MKNDIAVHFSGTWKWIEEMDRSFVKWCNGYAVTFVEGLLAVKLVVKFYSFTFKRAKLILEQFFYRSFLI